MKRGGVSTPKTTKVRCVEADQIPVEDSVYIVEFRSHVDERLTVGSEFVGIGNDAVVQQHTVQDFTHFRIRKGDQMENVGWLEIGSHVEDVLTDAARCCKHVAGGTLTIEFVTKECVEENPDYCEETVHGNRWDGSYFHPNCKQCVDGIQWLTTTGLVREEANTFSRKNPIDVT